MGTEVVPAEIAKCTAAVMVAHASQQVHLLCRCSLLFPIHQIFYRCSNLNIERVIISVCAQNWVTCGILRRKKGLKNIYSTLIKLF